MTAQMAQAVEVIAKDCNLDKEQVAMWILPLMSAESRDTVETIIGLFARGYTGKVEVKRCANGRLSDLRLPDGVNEKQVRCMIGEILHEPRR